MITAVFVVTGMLYAAACVLYLAFLIRGHDRVAQVAAVALGGAAASHATFLAADFALEGHVPYETVHQTLATCALVIVLVYLAVLSRQKIGVLGAFITPVALLFFVGAGLGRAIGGEVPPTVKTALLPIHVGLNVLGIAAFALAFASACGYVIQERQLRQKKLGGLFERLPSLDALDSLGFRLVIAGFPLLTLGIITGTVWAVRLDPSAPAITTAQAFALLTWLVFAGVLLLRVAAGWRGRRAAIGTMLGFACAMAVLLGYMLRAGGGVSG